LTRSPTSLGRARRKIAFILIDCPEWRLPRLQSSATPREHPANSRIVHLQSGYLIAQLEIGGFERFYLLGQVGANYVA
jgi:hypothetical protein